MSTHLYHTYTEIASVYRIWVEYVGSLGVASEQEFEAVGFNRRLEHLEYCFGKESPRKHLRNLY